MHLTGESKHLKCQVENVKQEEKTMGFGGWEGLLFEGGDGSGPWSLQRVPGEVEG